VFLEIVTQDLGVYQSKAVQPAGTVLGGLTAWNIRSDRQALSSARSDRLVRGPTATGARGRSPFPAFWLSTLSFSIPIHLNTHEKHM